ncbi:MAG TPA: hypothetical protein V6D50_15975 [Chroococcales cyanobacterium]
MSAFMDSERALLYRDILKKMRSLSLECQEAIDRQIPLFVRIAFLAFPKKLRLILSYRR